MLRKFRTLAEFNVAFRHPQTAVNHFKKIRWGKTGRFCPHCGATETYQMKPKNRYRCAECRTDFSVTVGTIFHDSKLPLKVWFAAIWLLTNHPKGIASTTLARDLGISQKSAWFVLHRLRHAARTKSFNAPSGGGGRRLRGTVEVDETYVGGKARNKPGRRSGQGGGPKGKTPVVGAVAREGGFVAKALPAATQSELQGFIHENVAPSAKLVTDAHPAYATLLGFPHHKIVNHNKGEWKRGNAHTNTIEGVWAQLKRQINGTHHWVSPKHLQKYVDEMGWRMDRRGVDAPTRVNALLADVEGRLTYKALTS